MTLEVRTISDAEHRAYVTSQPTVALQQTPGWGRGFVNARTESVGWFDNGVLIGAGLFRYRGLPRLPMRSVAVFEQGPDIDWTGRRRTRMPLKDWTDPLIDHLRRRGVFTVRVNPTIATREWWGVDPGQVAARRDVVVHNEPADLTDAQTCSERLTTAGWRPQPNGAATFVAEVVLTARTSLERLPSPFGSRSILPGYQVSLGAREDLDAVQSAVKALHSGIATESAADLRERWAGLSSDDLAGVSLLVVRRGETVAYGGLMAVVGSRAWDLSPALPQPDADLPLVQVLRSHVIRVAREQGAKTLTVPTVVSHRHAPVAGPAPGWPPVHLSKLVGTWHFPVRATWHAALSPIVDRLML